MLRLPSPPPLKASPHISPPLKAAPAISSNLTSQSIVTLPKLRRSELNARLAGIETELDYWKQQTQPGARFERHCSQVQRLATVVGEPITGLRRELEKIVDDQELLAQAEQLEKNVLALHSIWEVFRSKLLLREDELLKTVLPAFDDLAWACYQPAMLRFGLGSKEPPLLYFTTLWSPFAQGRDTSFQNEVRASVGALNQDEFLDILQSLPVPLIGLPWYHAAHIPGAIVIAHEVGHIVERDFGLTPAIQAAVKGAGLAEPDAWSSWATEVFADVYGCLGMGPAFVGAMMDLLASGLAVVHEEKPKPNGKYPTRSMRVSLMLQVLQAIALNDEAQRLDATWQATYGPRLIPTGYEADIPKVVASLLRGPYLAINGTPIALNDVLNFPQDYLQKAKDIADDANNGWENNLRTYRETRCFFAAARYLHENPPAGPFSNATYQRLVEAIVTKGEGETRMRGSVSRSASSPPPQTVTSEQVKADQNLGQDLLKQLIAMRDS